MIFTLVAASVVAPLSGDTALSHNSDPHDRYAHHADLMSDDDAAAMAQAAEAPAAWRDGQTHQKVAHIRVLGLNDFHGQITLTQTFTDARKQVHPVGSIPVLTSWLKDAQATAPAGPESVLITDSGDLVGASVPESGLLRDEPAILWFNQLANQ